MTIDHMIPSVEDAAWRAGLARHCVDYTCLHVGATVPCPLCLDGWQDAENAALALDMANAAASDRRRAANDELRRTVAW